MTYEEKKQVYINKITNRLSGKSLEILRKLYDIMTKFRLIMKKLSIEEKSQRYDEALKKAKDFYKGYKQRDNQLYADDLESIFSNLKESKDERIRKGLIEGFQQYDEEECWRDIEYLKIKDILDWLEKQETSYTKKDVDDAYFKGISDTKNELEKQGEQKPFDYERQKDFEPKDYNSIDPHFGKSIDKIEPIFNVGDKIQYLKGCGTIMTIEKIENGEYIFGNNMGHTTIENGNKWYLVNRVGQKSAWSEEAQEEQVSEEFINSLGTMLNDGLPDKYLVSEERVIKSAELLFSIARKQLKNEMQEWSEEDEKIVLSIEQVMNCASLLNMVPEKENKIRTWLKSLKERYTWKPNDEQLKSIQEVIDVGHFTSYPNALETLYEQLKKLRDE